MSMMVNSYRFGTTSPSPGLGYFTSESLGEVVTSSSLAVPIDALTVAPSSGDLGIGETYVGFWSIEVRVFGAAPSAFVERDGIQILGVGHTNKEQTSPIDYNSFGGMFIESAGGTPTYKVQSGRASGGGTVTVFHRDARLSFLKLGADDHYTESATRQTTASTTLQTAATLSFTPGSSGDYLVLASCVLDRNGSSADSADSMKFELSDGTTSTPALAVWTINPLANGNALPVLVLLPLSAISGLKNVTLKYCNGGTSGAAVGISNVVMVALRRDRFANSYVTSLGVDNSGTDATYTDALAQTFTPAAADHLTIAGWLAENLSSTISTYAEFDDGGTVVCEGNREGWTLNADAGGFPFSTHRIASYAASSRTQAIKRKSETTGAATYIKRGAAIATFDLTGI